MVKILWNIYLAIVFCALVPRVSQLKTNRTIKLILGNLVQKKQHSEVTIWLPLSEFSFTYAQWQPHFTTKLLYFTTKQSLLCHCDLIPAAWCLRNSLASMLSTGLKRLSVVSCDDVTTSCWLLFWFFIILALDLLSRWQCKQSSCYCAMQTLSVLYLFLNLLVKTGLPGWVIKSLIICTVCSIHYFSCSTVVQQLFNSCSTVVQQLFLKKKEFSV